MSKMSKFTSIGRLLEKYGVLLTTHQLHVMERYYFYDLSMQEIADEEHITRSAVGDIIHQSSDKLREYEQKLLLLAAEKEILTLLERLKKAPAKELQEIINQIKDILTHGI